jgi:hypothetical protein
MTEVERDALRKVDAAVQTEEGRGIVDEQAQTNGNLMPDNSRVMWNRVRVIFCCLPFVITFLLGIYCWQKILSISPKIRQLMFDEQSEVCSVTETEQGVLWTIVFLPVTSLYLNIGIQIYKLAQCVPFIASWIARFTFVRFCFDKIREQVVKHAIVPRLKKWALHFAKQCLKLMVFLTGVMLMIIGLHSIMEQYNFAFHMHAFVSHLRGAIPCV